MTTVDRDGQLVAFCERWVGYGSPDAPVWLVGLEEGGAGTWREVEQRLDQWESRGRPQFSQFRPTPVPAGHRWFGEQPRLQPYWSRLARLVLASEGRELSTESVRRYQQTNLAAPHDGAALLELLPLPSPSTSQWLYSDHSMLRWLSSRHAYETQILPSRIRLLRRLIHEHAPVVVVFVGASARPSWEEIAGRQLPDDPERPVELSPGSVAVIIKHPSAFGVTNAYYEATGAAIAASRQVTGE